MPMPAITSKAGTRSERPYLGVHDVPHRGHDAPDVSTMQGRNATGETNVAEQGRFDWGSIRPEKRRRVLPYFEGPKDEPDREARLQRQLDDIRRLMLDGHWRTLATIAETTGHPPASVSAQLRHLRKARFGSYTVNKRHMGHGLYEYQVLRGDAA
jgi:hypothetical protein